MADYWKSQGRKFCDFCKCWIADNKPSIEFHEGGKKHKENVSKRLKEIHKSSTKQAKQNKKFQDDLKKMENAGMAAYLKDVENNTRDMTAERIIKEKLNKPETKETPNYNRMPPAAPETNPRFRGKSQQFTQDVDPCDPMLSRSMAMQPRSQQGGENRAQGKSKTGKGKGKGKKTHEDNRPSKPVQKLWYEALSPEGYTYYWHIETNESIWEPPEEGFMTIAEQEEEAKEQAVQEELLEQLEKEEAIAKADTIEEQRANAEREKMKAMRKTEAENSKSTETTEDDEEGTVDEERPYRRDYSLPVKSHPYGPWQTVQKVERKPVDLQLPQQKQIQLPTFPKSEPPAPQRTFKEKTVEQINAGDSDDDGRPATFKKRKIGNKSVRKRVTDD